MGKATHTLIALLVVGLAVTGAQPPAPATAGPMDRGPLRAFPIGDESDDLRPSTGRRVSPSTPENTPVPTIVHLVAAPDWALNTAADNPVEIRTVLVEPVRTSSADPGRRQPRWFERLAGWIYGTLVKPALRILLSH